MQRRTLLKALAAFLPAASLRGLNADAGARLRLITRGDDLGCARSLNRAMKECFEKGILKNCSVLAPAPFIDEGARLLARHKALCFGLHCALTSEWVSRRWGPVAPRERVSSLVDRQGYLHLTNEAARASARSDEALVELQAQLDKARRLGFDIKYADLHMNTVSLVPGLLEPWSAWCKSQGLIAARAIGRRLPMPDSWNSPDRRIQGDYVEQLIAALKSAEPGDYLIVGHPGYLDSELRGLGHAGYPGEAVAHNLNWQRQAFVDARVLRYCRQNDVQPVRYDEVASANGAS